MNGLKLFDPNFNLKFKNFGKKEIKESNRKEKIEEKKSIRNHQQIIKENSIRPSERANRRYHSSASD